MKPVKRIFVEKKKLYYLDDLLDKITGKNPRMFGNCTKLRGDCSGLWGDCSKLSGDCTKLSGDCTGLSGNLNDIPLNERVSHPNLSYWTEAE